MNLANGINRREFLKASATGAAALSLNGCVSPGGRKIQQEFIPVYEFGIAIPNSALELIVKNNHTAGAKPLSLEALIKAKPEDVSTANLLELGFYLNFKLLKLI